jgi:hypothetical protein
MQRYLVPSQCIDFEDASVRALAMSLEHHASSELELVRKCFELVRDEIRHTSDFRLNLEAIRGAILRVSRRLRAVFEANALVDAPLSRLTS